MIFSNEEKAFDKIEYSFMMKTLRKVDMEAKYLNMIKTIYDKPKANIILIDENVKTKGKERRQEQS